MRNVTDRKKITFSKNPLAAAAAAVSQLLEQIKNVSGKAGKDFAPDQTDYTIHRHTTPNCKSTTPFVLILRYCCNYNGAEMIF